MIKIIINYGARGIKICDEWLNDRNIFCEWSLNNGFENNKKLSIDRIDSNKDYSPDNCRWENAVTQGRNTRRVKMTLEKAREIRKKYDNNKCYETIVNLSNEYLVSDATIYLIIQNIPGRNNFKDGMMPQDNQYLSHIEPLDIFCWYDQQRFLQFGAMDCANWYGVTCESGKKGQAMYPAMGRAHVNFHNLNKLIFNNEPHAIFRSNNFAYVVDGVLLWQIDRFFNQRLMTSDLTLNAAIWFDTLPVDTTTINMLTDGVQIFLITEPAAGATTCVLVTDANAPKNPTYVAAFGNRFVVSQGNSPTSLHQLSMRHLTQVM